MSLTIKTYLKKATSHQLYSEGLKLFNAHGGAMHYPKISQKLNSGYFGSNKTLLLHHLRLLQNVSTPQSLVVAPKVIVHSPEKLDPPPTPQNQPKIISMNNPETKDYYAMLKEYRQAVHKRMQLSEGLHDCQNQAEAIIQLEKLEAQTAIVNNYKAQKEYYQKNGTMPEKEELEEVWKLADNKADLQKQYKRISDQIRNTENSIKHWTTKLESGENWKARAKLIKAEDRRKDLLIRKSLIKEKLNEYKNSRKQGAAK